MNTPASINRRDFCQRLAAGGLAGACFKPEISLGDQSPEKSHLITLSFDDGYKKSFEKIATIYEDLGIKACLNVIAFEQMSNSKPGGTGSANSGKNDWAGNFDDWNRLKSRGHEIMMHGWEHHNHAQQPFEVACDEIRKCVEIFERNLDGFKADEAVFNFPYNASNEALDKFTLSLVRAIRTAGKSAINPMPQPGKVRLTCASHGPDNSDDWLKQQIDSFLAMQGGWLVLNLHGLDDEGWGPITSRYLVELLTTLKKNERAEMLPVGQALNRVNKETR